ncbi:predicted protein, partial [Nematostella vectensis]
IYELVMAPLWLSAFALLDVLIVIGNMLTILTFIHSPHLRRRSMYLIINLAVADLLIGLIPLPIFFSGFYYGFIVKLGIPRLLALLHTPLDSWLGLVSIFNLVLISIERLLAMVFPLRNRRISGRVYRYIISVSWLLPGIIVGLHSWVMFHGYRYVSADAFKYLSLASTFVLLVMLLTVFSSYTAMVITFKRQSYHTHQMGNLNQVTQRKQVQEQRLTWTLFLVTAASLITWLPFLVINQLYRFTSLKISIELAEFTVLLHYLNSVINPIFYVGRISEFKRSLIKLLCKRCRNDDVRDL